MQRSEEERTYHSLGSHRPTAALAQCRLAASTLIGVALIALPIGGAYYAWDRWGERITADGDYVLRAGEFSDHPATGMGPSGCVRAEVIRDGSLTGLSLLDPQLTVKVFQAFAAHSWVENVSRVSKHPPGGRAGVVVEMTYRKPVAMVEVD
jgi:hypothetical protein